MTIKSIFQMARTRNNINERRLNYISDLKSRSESRMFNAGYFVVISIVDNLCEEMPYRISYRSEERLFHALKTFLQTLYDLSESAKDDALTLYNGNPDFIDGVNAAYAMAVEILGIHFHFHF
mgnify:CR=1 FL=1